MRISFIAAKIRQKRDAERYGMILFYQEIILTGFCSRDILPNLYENLTCILLRFKIIFNFAMKKI